MTAPSRNSVGYQRLLGFACVQVLDAAIAPWLLELFGVGPISAAQLLDIAATPGAFCAKWIRAR